MTIEKRRAGLLNRITLAYVYQWLNQHTERMETEMPDICYKLKSAGYASKVINGFSDEERVKMNKVGHSPEYKVLEKVEISLVVMALEVMKIHVQTMPPEMRTPKLNISDKKLAQGKGAYAMYMLKAKTQDKTGYDIQKEIIDTTSKHAQDWYSFMYSAIIEGKFTDTSDDKS